MSSKSPVLFSGHWTSTIIMALVYLLFRLAALVPQYWKRNQYRLCIYYLVSKLTSAQTMSRLRELSHFECHVRVLRNKFCKNVSLGEDFLHR